MEKEDRRGSSQHNENNTIDERCIDYRYEGKHNKIFRKISTYM